MELSRSKLRSRTFGGKARAAHLIWSRFGDVSNYLEPFFGSGAVLLCRPQPFRGTETVNDADGMVSNAWRALQAAPDEVAHWADWPVVECDLHARHAWLVQRKDSLQERLEGDPDYFNAKVAGWWLWGMACWIGSGFCSGNGPWQVVEAEDGSRQLVHLSGAGQGVNRKRVHLGGAGRGVNRKRDDRTEGLIDYFHALADRLRDVRVCCGDWTRVMGDTVLFPINRNGDSKTAVFCMHPETLIRLQDETLVEVSSITPGSILHGNRTVQTVMSRQHDGEMLSIKVQGVLDPLQLTPEHRVPRVPACTGRQETRTKDQLWSAIETVPASELKPNDLVLIPLGGHESPVTWSIDDSLRSPGHRQCRVVFDDQHPELLARVIGRYSAQGNIRYRYGDNGGVQWTYGEHHRHDHAIETVDIIQKCFGVELHESKPHLSVVVPYTGSTVLGRFFRHYCPGKARTKQLHRDLMTAPAAIQKELLIGWSADGGCQTLSRNRTKLCITTGSRSLAMQMFQIALRCGLRPSHKMRQSSPTYNLVHDIYFASEDTAALGFPAPLQRRTGACTRRIVNNHILSRIRTIESRHYTGVVYDLDVDGDDLIPAPFVLIHNCDPPYADTAQRNDTLYRVDSLSVAHDVREWCIAHGDDPRLRIALAGYEGEHQMPDSWECVVSKATTGGGYGNQAKAGYANANRERLWFSPHCIKPTDLPLFAGLDDDDSEDSP
ncbi:MAG: hypothetical protein AB7G11_11160 [Phycisphaerales bacterium]